MAHGDVTLEREIHLAKPANSTPLPQKHSKTRGIVGARTSLT
jgi:hypothetical protein